MTGKEGIDWLEDVEFEEGEINVFGSRYAFVDITVFYNIRERMKRIVGSAADRLIYLSTKDHTKGFTEKVLDSSKLAKFVKKFGWGKEKIGEKMLKFLSDYGYGKARKPRLRRKVCYNS